MRNMWIIIAICVLVAVGCDQRAREKHAAMITGGDPRHGKEIIGKYGCGSCHTIPGVHGANTWVGPPLMMMGRRTYIAGVLKNTPENMIKWLQDPPSIDPKTAMPNVHLSETDAKHIAAYLYTLE